MPLFLLSLTPGNVDQILSIFEANFFNNELSSQSVQQINIRAIKISHRELKQLTLGNLCSELSLVIIFHQWPGWHAISISGQFYLKSCN